VGSPVERAVNVGKSGPVAPKIIRHDVNGIDKPVLFNY